MGRRLIATLIGPDCFFPAYDIVPAGKSYTMAYNEKTRIGYQDICYNQNLDLIFLLYSGECFFTEDKKRNLKTDSSNVIFVLDGKDTLVEKIVLDKGISSMKFSEDGSFLYGLSESEILKFKYSNRR